VWIYSSLVRCSYGVRGCLVFAKAVRKGGIHAPTGRMLFGELGRIVEVEGSSLW
jgi:hypothetical protein